ncbi:MAG TPA: type II toxin-antitoxin system ParD family antitoxin [Tepidisphaeraceae bacterium]|jgi:putative addiction module CopG family antidote
MQVTLKPQTRKFIEEQVQAGRFASPDEAIEAGMARLMCDPEPDVLDDEDRAAIRESLAQIERGEVIDSKVFGEELKRKYPIKKV